VAEGAGFELSVLIASARVDIREDKIKTENINTLISINLMKLNGAGEGT
jgi:hypothetical protein